jgi:hypothetical protein
MVHKQKTHPNSPKVLPNRPSHVTLRLEKAKLVATQLQTQPLKLNNQELLKALLLNQGTNSNPKLETIHMVIHTTLAPIMLHTWTNTNSMVQVTILEDLTVLRADFIKGIKVMACLLELPTITLLPLQLVASEDLLFMVVTVHLEVYPIMAVLDRLSHLKLPKRLEEAALSVVLTMRLAEEAHTKVKVNSITVPSKATNKVAVTIWSHSETRRLRMDQAHHCLKLADRDPQQTRPLDQHFLHRNLSKLGTEATLPISSNKAMADSTVAKPAAMLVWAELEVTKQEAKGIKTANTEVTKLSEATTMATASSSVEDGVATTDSSINMPWMATFVASYTASVLVGRLLPHGSPLGL